MFAVRTFQPSSLAEPRYSGLIAAAPSLVGSAEAIVTRFESYRAQLTKLVTNVSKLYEAVSTLPLYDADDRSIRVLHVSDIHINPIAWNVIRSLKDQFSVDLIIDTGDISDHGTQAENKFAEEIGTLGVPYVFVRGNHDSKATQRAVAKQKNAIVLDDKMRNVEGLDIYGLGDPRFTPDKTTAVNPDPASMEQFGRDHRAAVEDADLVAVHDDIVARGFSGTTPLVLSGHAHVRKTTMLPTGTRVIVQGSTGGASPARPRTRGTHPRPGVRSVLRQGDETPAGLGRHHPRRPRRAIGVRPTSRGTRPGTYNLPRANERPVAIGNGQRPDHA
ncbi:metallophosphoesterase [Nonomuraea ferruginea]